MYKIVLKTANNKIRVTSEETHMKIQTLERTFVIRETGRKGDTGAGLPDGGLQGQVPYKKSAVDYDIEWRFPSIADKTFVQYFTALDSLLVKHDLNKYPSVTIVDSAGDEVEGSIDYVDVNTITVNFAYPTSGLISCN